MIDNFSPPTLKERLMAVALLLLVILIAGSMIYKLLAEPQLELNTRLEQLRIDYENALRLEYRRGELEQQLRNWQEALANNDSLLLPESSFNLAAAALQERINSIVSLHDSAERPCRIQQQKNMPSVDEGSFTKVTVNIVLSCMLEPLQAVLYDLEVEKPVLILNDLIVRTNKRANRQPLDLNVSVDISGYIEKDAAISLGARK